jgi:hypothetical protein
MSRLSDEYIPRSGHIPIIISNHIGVTAMKLPSNPKNNHSVSVSETWEQINQNAAGIDLGSREHWVCVPKDRADQNVRRFGCFTPDLIAMANWLMECGVDTVAIACNWGLLDSSVSNFRSQRAESQTGECTPRQNRAWT